MDYQNYEDYMREVLGYQSMENNLYNQEPYHTYMPEQEIYYDMPNQMEQNTEEELNQLYPDIYRIIYPMVCKICNQNSHRKITREVLDEMTLEIYKHVEAEDKQTRTNNKPLKSGEVRVTNTRNTEENQTRQTNFFMQDLIRILLIKELTRPGRRPPVRPPVAPHPRPPIRPRPPMGPPPPPRPRGYNGLY